MTERTRRILWGILIVPVAALAGFLVGGNLAAWLADSGSALADGASVALAGLGCALVGTAGAAWAVARRPPAQLPRMALILAVLTALGIWFTSVAAGRRAGDERLASPVSRLQS